MFQVPMPSAGTCSLVEILTNFMVIMCGCLLRSLPAIATWAQGIKQRRQPIVIEFVHQCEKLPQLPRGETFAGKPVEIVTGEVCDETALVFAEGHGDRDEIQEILSIHGICAR